MFCTRDGDFTVALWRATGSSDHVDTVIQLLARKGITLRPRMQEGIRSYEVDVAP